MSTSKQRVDKSRSPGSIWDSLFQSIKAEKKEHLVQFYSNEAFLYESVGNYIESGLKEDDGILIIATPEHNERFKLTLETRGYDIEMEVTKQKFVLLDVMVILPQILIDEMPDEGLFEKVIGETITKMKAQYSRVRIYTEMMDFFFEKGSIRGTLVLETCWSTLIQTQSCILLCSYKKRGFEGSKNEKIFQEICQCHSRIIPVESLKTVREACILASTSLVQNFEDISFCMIYFLDQKNNQLILKSFAGLKRPPIEIPLNLESYSSFLTTTTTTTRTVPTSTSHITLLTEALKQNKRVEIHDLQSWLGSEINSTTAVVFPFNISGDLFTHPEGILIIGVDSRQTLDEYYHELLQQIKTQLINMIILSKNHEQQQLQAEQDLRTEKEAYLALISILPIGICRYNAEKGMFDVNPALSEISGVPVKGWMDGTWPLGIHPDDRDRIVSGWEHALKIHQGFQTKEYRWLHQDGSIRWATGEALVQLDSNGNLLEYVCAVVDITEVKTLAEEKERAEQQAKRAEEAEKNAQYYLAFSNMLAHEIRNPLNAISCSVELLKSELKSREAILTRPLHQLSYQDLAQLRQQLHLDREVIEAIDTCVKHQTVVANGVLESAKIEANKMELSQIEFDVKNKIYDVIKMLKPQADRSQVKIYLTAGVEDIVIKGDPDRFSAILTNLLSNAIKFTKNGSISIFLDVLSITPEETTLHIVTEDSGIGMTQQQIDNLFQRFSQATSETFHEHGGSGLGLYYSKRFIELMGGSINVKSQVGKGTTFDFTIKGGTVDPKERLSSNSSISLPSLNHPPSSPSQNENHEEASPQKILLVEDNLINQMLVSRLIQKGGLTCQIAADGVEALKALEKSNYNFDLILMDIQMPNMNGIEATKEIRNREEQFKKTKRIPIIGLSGVTDQELITKATHVGMDDYISKPVSGKALLEKIIQHTQKLSLEE